MFILFFGLMVQDTIEFIFFLILNIFAETVVTI